MVKFLTIPAQKFVDGKVGAELTGQLLAPMTLNLSDMFEDNAIEKITANYKLVAIINHLGDSLDSDNFA